MDRYTLRPGTSTKLGLVSPSVATFIAFASDFVTVGDGSFS